MAEFNAQTLTEAVIQRLAATPDPRLREIMTSLITHLHGFVHEVRPTEEEWLAGIQFLTAVGQKCDDKRQEFILLSDTLGATTMKDIINNRKPPGVTEYTILGPFHRSDAPQIQLHGNIAAGI